MDLYVNHLKRQGFELLDEIGSGLSGTTKKAKQTSLDRYVAVKFFDNAINKQNADLKKKFVREAYILAEVQHPAIPYVITHGKVAENNGNESVPYIVMEFIDGTDLEDYVQNNGVLRQEQVINVASQILGALSLVHAKGIIHRDIKPANIMLSSKGHAYLIDFSIGYSALNKANFTRATRTGDGLGSSEYMSPEQRSNMKDVDCRADIYSLGLTLCKLLTGVPTLAALDKPELSIPYALRRLIKKAVEHNVDERYQSVKEILRELQSLSSAGHFALNSPSKALCNNLTCPDANWSPNGYYRGANFIEDCTDIHCTSCGNKLVYQCGCGYQIADTRYCGGCGTELFKVPECQKCGSYLTKKDMNKDTSKGCSKCLSKPRGFFPQQAPSPRFNPASVVRSNRTNSENQDDDIPF